MTERTGIEPNVDFVLYVPGVSSDMLAMQHLYNAYQTGPDTHYANWWDFKRQVEKGHVVAGQVVRDGEVIALFGLELMTKPNPWLNVLFYAGHIDRQILRSMAHRLYATLQFYKAELGRTDEVGAVRMQGRSGWQKIARALGYEMDRRGFVFDDQEGLKHGYVSRFI